MVKVLSFRLQQCCYPFVLLSIKESSETRLFGSKHVFGVRNFGNTSAMSVMFFRKCRKSNLDLKNSKKIPE